MLDSRSDRAQARRSTTISEPDLIPDQTPRASSVAGGILRTARPRQWVKNVLVIAAPLAGVRILEPAVLLDTAIAFAAFCLAASGVYLLNDALDIEADRAHPKKRTRPIAAGVVPLRTAYAAAVVLFLASVAIALLAGLGLAGVMAFYIALQIAYCIWLKHQPILDIAVVSSGFLLRMIAGGVATDIRLSQWFLIVAVFGSLLMVAGKRYAEILATHERTGEVRGSLKGYTRSYLAFVWHTAATVLVLGYSLWAFESSAGGGNIWLSLSVAPFVLAALRYTQHIDRGDAEAPEDIALGDRMLQAFALAWIVLVAVGIYLPG
ncbi:decaprenyl-phosphate phosphoribosyltransferase [Naasia lichenicola]|uniref:Decaprenyl-phosphate phosphoribosyltransferase n=1 Tax=Naasia lichenicola TaxID=2565933 RepID=A0A4S4FL95_9MICO|nr:decaprenyl-phosphate phosphoribosyltransferase [Naasia lichenicola]THG30834.1 decaprenyl-phosphate phosphoribosyltransferase [Naasia lichenicola]